MRTIVISAGTSLLTNNRGILDCSDQVLDYFQENQAAVDKIAVTVENGEPTVCPDTIPGLYNFTKGFTEKYFKDTEIKRNIKKRDRGEDRLPAEISSLYLYYYDRNGRLRDEFKKDLAKGSGTDFRKKDRVILLTTDTADAFYCAQLLRELINSISLFNTECLVDQDIAVIKNLDVYEPYKWAEPAGGTETTEPSGLKTLYNYFHNLSECLEETEKIIIRTGGYKELCANLLMLAIEKGFKSYYLFERSYEFISVDLADWPDSYFTIATNMQRRG